jgi:sec-independent protein translocase protein TatA
MSVMSPLFAIIDAPIIAVIIGIAVLLFGADKIPKLARSMGEAKKEFESASRGPTTPPSSTPPGSTQPGDASSGQPTATPPSQTPAPPQ